MFTLRNRCLLTVFVLITFGVATGQQGPGDWRKVKKKIGAQMVVVTKSGQSLDGSLLNATEASLKVNVQGKTEEVKKDDVAEVRIRKKDGGRKLAWIGGLAAPGFAVGAGIGKAANPYDDSGWGQFGPVIGGAIGAAGGALTGAVVASMRSKVVGEETIYRSP
ncbi:MAG: hypothetical protein ACREEM_53740 [Blastocatellia bacterium]